MISPIFDSIDFGQLLKSINKKSSLEYKSGSSTKASDRLQRLDAGYIATNGFEDFFIGNVMEYDWVKGADNRNWWWQVQSLTPLSDFVDSFDVTGEEYFNLSVSYFVSWNNGACYCESSPLAWHDHASAFRLRNIVKWFLFCAENKLFNNIEDKLKDEICLSIFNHIEWLLKIENYSVFTNHGFDQALILYRISILFLCEPFSSFIMTESKKRLLNEIDFAFTDEGVHKENSPGYQQFMIARLKEVARLSLLGEEEVSKYSDETIVKAKQFLQAITLPDGMLPTIGDSQSIKSVVNADDVDFSLDFDFSGSGYYIKKSINIYGDKVYFLLKNAHDSNYHRHDDDLMIYFWVKGETLLGDAGLLSHEEGSLNRLFVRSHFAHNLPYIYKKNATRDLRNKNNKNRVLSEPDRVLAVSDAFNVGLERSVDLLNLNSGVLEVKDRLAHPSDDELFVNYFFPKVPYVSCNTSSFKQFVFESNFLTFSNYDGLSSDLIFQGESGSISTMAIQSNSFGKYCDGLRLSMAPIGGELKSRLQAQPISNNQGLNSIKLGGALSSIVESGGTGLIVKNTTSKASYISLYFDEVGMNKIDVCYQGEYVCFDHIFELEITSFGGLGGDVIFILGYDISGDRCETFRLEANKKHAIEFSKKTFKYIIFLRVLPSSLVSFENIKWNWIIRQ